VSSGRPESSCGDGPVSATGRGDTTLIVYRTDRTLVRNRPDGLRTSDGSCTRASRYRLDPLLAHEVGRRHKIGVLVYDRDVTALDPPASRRKCHPGVLGGATRRAECLGHAGSTPLRRLPGYMAGRDQW
jgi:hypothetical protein